MSNLFVIVSRKILRICFTVAWLLCASFVGAQERAGRAPGFGGDIGAHIASQNVDDTANDYAASEDFAAEELGQEDFLSEDALEPMACNCSRCRALGQEFTGIAGVPLSAVNCLSFYNLWVRADYELWSLEPMTMPALATTSPAGTSAANLGVLGRASTSSAFGGDINDEFRSGGRFTVGFMSDPARHVSWEASYFGLGNAGDSFYGTSFNGFPNLARPVFDTGTGSEASLIVAQAGTLSGSLAIDTASQLQMVDVIRRNCLWGDSCYQLDLLLGYKYGQLDDKLQINQSSTYVTSVGPIVSGTNLRLIDNLRTSNSFNGFEFGLQRRQRCNRWYLVGTGKVSLGSNRSEVTINGLTTTTVPNAGSSTSRGGLLAQSTNIGNYERSQFIAIPELVLRIERPFSDQWRLHAGYSLMYWSAATRVDDIVSRRVSQFPPEAVTGTREPAFRFQDSGFLAHGFQFGMDYKF